jgi:hypothetical protein
MKKVVLIVYCGALVVGITLNHAGAMPQFKKEFQDKYVKKDSSDAAEKSLADAFETASCLVCHTKKADGKADNKSHNVYGKSLKKLISKKDAKDKEKIREALDKVAGEKVDPSKPDSPTFGELIKAGKLPGGEIKK